MAKRISSTSTRPRGPGLFSRPSPLATHNELETNKLIADLQRAIRKSDFASLSAQQQLAQRFTFDALGATPLPVAVRQAYSTCATALVRNALPPLYSLPVVSQNSDPVSGHQTRQRVRSQIDYLASEHQHIHRWKQQIASALGQIARALPPHKPAAGSLSISVPLISTLKDPVGVIDQLVRTLMQNAVDPTDPSMQPGQSLSRIIVGNLLTASKRTLVQVKANPHQALWPAQANLSAEELVEVYLQGSPFAALFQTEIDLVIDVTALVEGVHIMASTGHGKTQALQSLFLKYLQHPERPSIIIIDSQGDTFKVLAKLRCFDPAIDDRTIHLDVCDIEPPALNFFGWDRQFADTLSPQRREEFLESVIQTFEFVSGGLLGAELTARMSTVFRYIAMWLIEIEGANIHTLIALLRDPSPYLHHVANLPPVAQDFIEQLYQARSPYRETKQHLLQRLYHVCSNPAFERMFGHRENKFDLRTAMNDGKIIFINTRKAQLQAEWSAILGRFWLSQFLQATMSREFIPLDQRRLCVALVDECHEYCDANTETLLSQARKYGCSLHLIHQTAEQLRKSDVLASVVANPSIRFVGAVSDADAKLFAKEMRTTPEFLKSVNKTDRSAEWAVYVRNLTPTATKVTIPFLEAERQPKMSAAAYERLLQRNRQLVGAPRRLVHPNRGGTTDFNNDGDDY